MKVPLKQVRKQAVENGVTGQKAPISVLMEIGLLILSALLFSLSFPSFISDWGWFPLAFIAIVPVFIVIHRAGWVRIFFYGAFFGFLSYAIFNYWETNFHPLAIFFIPVVYMAYFILLFPLLKAADTLFPKVGWILQSLIWIGYEYLKTAGFLGYPYGIIGYTQYPFIPLIQIAEITGVLGVSLLVILPSAFLGRGLKDGFPGLKTFFREQRFLVISYSVLFTLTLIFGILEPKDYSEAPKWRVAMVQHNADTWKGGFAAYERNFETLTRLSGQALEEDPDIVFWSETAFVPGVDWHTRYRTDLQRYELVKRFRDFMAIQDIPYVTGNSDGQLKNPGLPPVLADGTYNWEHYNAVLLYDGELMEIYRKTKLVPFTEHFPYEKQFPRFYRFLKENDFRWWGNGEEYTVFDARGIRFSTPICYEDVFGNIVREFTLGGAEVIVNLTNDSWSRSVVAEIQHGTMVVFRAIENRRTVVRSTNSGLTCTIEPSGRITSYLEPFTEGYLIQEVPVYTGETTLYTRWGDWFAFASMVTAFFWLLTGLILRGIRTRPGPEGRVEIN